MIPPFRPPTYCLAVLFSALYCTVCFAVGPGWSRLPILPRKCYPVVNPNPHFVRPALVHLNKGLISIDVS